MKVLAGLAPTRAHVDEHAQVSGVGELHLLLHPGLDRPGLSGVTEEAWGPQIGGRAARAVRGRRVVDGGHVVLACAGLGRMTAGGEHEQQGWNQPLYWARARYSRRHHA